MTLKFRINFEVQICWKQCGKKIVVVVKNQVKNTWKFWILSSIMCMKIWKKCKREHVDDVIELTNWISINLWEYMFKYNIEWCKFLCFYQFSMLNICWGGRNCFGRWEKTALGFVVWRALRTYPGKRRSGIYFFRFEILHDELFLERGVGQLWTLPEPWPKRKALENNGVRNMHVDMIMLLWFLCV